MTTRIYDFPLPVHISGFQDSIGISDLKDAGIWDRVPTDLQTKMTNASSWLSGGADITKADLDELPDNVWSFIADKLNLKWRTAT